jgi:hypothetical protein
MEPSKILVTLGSVILLAGLILTYLPWLLNWFGKLPGDIKIQNEHSFIFIPISSMLIVSLVVRQSCNDE